MKTITFPSSASLIGGAEHVVYGERIAKIKLPGVTEHVKLKRIHMHPNDPSKWTSFNLADMALRSQNKYK